MVRPSIHATNGTETLTQICQIFYYISDSFFRKLSELAMNSIGLSGDFWVQILLSVARSCKATDSARMARPLGLCANPKRTRSQSTMPSLTSSGLQTKLGRNWLGRYWEDFSSRLVFRTTKQTKPSTKEEEIHARMFNPSTPCSAMPSKGHLKILIFNSFINFKSIKWKLQCCCDNHTRHGLVTRDSSIATSAAPRMKVQQNQLRCEHFLLFRKGDKMAIWTKKVCYSSCFGHPPRCMKRQASQVMSAGMLTICRTRGKNCSSFRGISDAASSPGTKSRSTASSDPPRNVLVETCQKCQVSSTYSIHWRMSDNFFAVKAAKYCESAKADKVGWYAMLWSCFFLGAIVPYSTILLAKHLYIFEPSMPWYFHRKTSATLWDRCPWPWHGQHHITQVPPIFSHLFGCHGSRPPSFPESGCIFK